MQTSGAALDYCARLEGRRTALIAATVLSLHLVACADVDAPARLRWISDNELRSADDDAANWLMYGRTYDEHRFSPLEQINEENVPDLGLAWSRELDTTRGLEATPLVLDGVIYTTGSWSVVYAIDAVSGAPIWTFDPAVPRERVARKICCDVVNRGVALYEDKLFVGTLDGRLIAIDAASGKEVWRVQTFDADKAYAITGYPRVADGRVLIGNAGAEFGVRGYVTAYDADTGAQVWRVYTVPGDPALGFESDAMARAAETWGDQWWLTGGGGTVWEGIVYDPELDYAYFGTGNPTAWYRALRGDEPQDNLYAASIVAVRVSDGEHIWHFQPTPGDNWDYDATQPLMLAELDLDGETRRVVMQASKNGFFYVLDRETGEFLSGDPFVDGVSWASALDPITGRPIETAGAYRGMEAIIASPAPQGAHNWNPMAFSPDTGLVYLPAKSGTQALHAPDPDWMYNPDTANIGRDRDYAGPMQAALSALPDGRGELLAWNPVARTAAWRVPYPVLEGGGVLATAGNLVFQGRGDGIFAAYRATDGKTLWQFDAATGIMAPPVTYLVEGVQYVTVMVGWGGPEGLINLPNQGDVRPGHGRILTFALGRNEAFNPPDYGHEGPPVPAIAVAADPETIADGQVLYATNCFGCHGANVIAGPVPDLRYSTAEVHDQFAAIVFGSRAGLGMPSFADTLDTREVTAIQAYILQRAAEPE